MNKVVRSHIKKNEILFLFFFILLIFALGNMFGEEKTEMNYKIIFLFSGLFLVFLHQSIVKKNIRFFTNNQNSKNLYILFVLSFVIITIIRDGLLNTYILTIFLTFVSTLIFIQFLYHIPFEKAIYLFLKAMFIVLLVNYYAHYLKVDTFSLELMDRTMERRFTGFFGGGLAGALSGLSAVVSLIIFLFIKGANKLFLIINLLLAWYGMILADNRTSLLACILIYILVFFYLSNKNFINKFLFVTLIAIIYLFYNYYSQNSTGGEKIGEDLDFRSLIWGLGIEQFTINPILGSGKENPFLNNFTSKKFDESLADPHNSYLYFILKNGILVAFFFFLFVFNFFVFSYKRLKKTKYFLLMSIPLYWIIISFTGGDYFNFNFNFSSVIFGISIFGIFNHPDLLKRIRR